VQPYFTVDVNDDGPLPPIKWASKTVLRISAEINVTDLPPARIDEAFELVFKYFSGSSISITEVQYWNNFFVIVLESDEIDMTKVPSNIGHCRCFDLFENEMNRPHPDKLAARKIPNATDTIVDNSVLVEDRTGERYLTVASHGFPHGSRIFHSYAGGRDIGHLVMEVSNTDIALVKLDENVRFTNETFEATSLSIPSRSRDRMGQGSVDVYGARIH
ncbi:hypothetical protein AOCH_007654, partial [Aspergillus ochraceoroseus]